MLREGDVDSAAISSAISPFTVRELGLQTLAYLGDELRFVTTGVATTEAILATQRGLMETLVGVFRRSLATIHDSPDDVVPIVADVLREREEIAAATYGAIRATYTRDGRVDRETLDVALATVGAEVRFGRDVSADDLYEFSLVDAGAP